RYAATDSAGNLTIGPRVVTPGSVLCFESFEQEVWFGWTNYDSTSTGLGRLNLQRFADTDQPVYASDLMVTQQGDVQTVQTFTDKRVFSVSGHGYYTSSSNKVASGTIDFGCVNFGIPDPKIGVFLHVDTTPLAGSISGYISNDDGAFSIVGTQTT